jgi:uncharacterized protein involved in exopolysaccharide biosynthesis
MSDTNATSADRVLQTQAMDPDVLKLFTAILRSKKFILLVGVLFAIVGMLISLKLPVRFTATAELMPPQVTRGGNTSTLLSQLSSASDAGFAGISSVLQAKTQAETYVVILDAWPIEEELVKRFGLVSVYHSRNETEARLKLKAHTVVAATKDGFITVTVTDGDRKRSAELANGYVIALQNFLHGLSLTEASQRRSFYEAELAKAKDDLTAAEVNFKKTQQSSGMISLDSQARTLIESAAGLRGEITAKEVELQELRTYSTEANPQVQLAETELSALRGQLAQMETHGQGGYSGGSLSSVPGAELDFVRATRDLKYQESLYDLMVKQYEGSRVDEDRDAPIVQVVEPALPPEFKSGPHRGIITLEFFAFGLFLGIIRASYRHWRSQLSEEKRTSIAELRKAAFQWRR